jgi:putative transposase
MEEPSERFVQPAKSPPHLFRPHACYFITAKTLHGKQLVNTDIRKQQVIDALRFACEHHGWDLVAWVVLSNHYHCILNSPEDAQGLSKLIASAHRFTSTSWNREDRAEGRTVWYRYRDSCVDHESSYWSRVNYIHYNPVKHRLVPRPDQYAFSSHRWWAENSDLPWLEGAYPWDRLDLEETE